MAIIIVSGDDDSSLIIELDKFKRKEKKCLTL